ncbi:MULTISPECIES: TRAP transporter small permease [Brevibacillus]|uniref:TRAP transporter small permease n=1 Tax=Brevibacillus invocatus TaxID=173959 RepID=A0A3M8CKC3_9BACL|nr:MULTISPECIES: TRAP transporter small permease [Brevibacillus]MCM3078276.1 TRAP transporter small permease [Brevibacillus invocatus]MCM3428569.1 TRAP transporter small permease [Brevibacillus invocatus]MDH4616942.1 TRAP transporter small permease [Brevibacillus sp. AY1]RNB76206.1 TRAP transporter small permease [Brevibacillus invocatus]
MEKALAVLTKVTNVLMAVCLSGMAILVFLNVVLRYAFDSGITWSEEMSRFLFVWLTFLGAIGALKDNSHLGVDMFIKKLPLVGKKVAFVLSNLIVLYVLWLVLDGSWKSTMISTKALSPAVGLPLSYIYGIGIVVSIGMAIIVLFNMYQVLFHKDAVERLISMKGSDEEAMEAVAAAEAAEETDDSRQKWHTTGGRA